jgi:hypothetical protein
LWRFPLGSVAVAPGGHGFGKGDEDLARWLRLWGKKRGSRMSGWWLMGQVGEAAFFGLLLLLGTVSLTTVVTWQVFWPESNVLRIGFGFWLMVIASSSFIIIGLTGFILKISRTLSSPERRSVRAKKAKRDYRRRSLMDNESSEGCLPDIQDLKDSPGVRLAYRLAEQSVQRLQLIVSALFVVAWNSLVAVLLVIAAQNFLSGKPSWFLNLLLLPFLTVSVLATHWFFRLFRVHAGIGPTAVEISDLPLLPGKTYQVYVCQYGRAVIKDLKIRLSGYEETTYQQGTDSRTERAEFASYDAMLEGAGSDENRAQVLRFPLRIEPENPLELVCQIRLPHDMMHSFHGMHNSVRWKIVVEGETPSWPVFYRSFPVVVYPLDAS